MSYADTHTTALALVTAKGAAVTFTMAGAGTHDPEAGTFTSPTTTTVTGQAVRVRANRTEEEAYRLAGLSTDRVLCLLFAPTTFGSLPTLGATVVWDGDTFTAKGITPVAPDGTAIIARVWGVR